MSEYVLTARADSIGREERSTVHANGLLHHCVHLICYNDSGVYLQRRAEDRKRNPGAWTSTVSGHVIDADVAGSPLRIDDEVLRNALAREVVEELGAEILGLDRAEYAGSVQTDSRGGGEICNCIDHVFRMKVDRLSTVPTEEVMAVSLFSTTAVARALATGRGLLAADGVEHPIADTFAPVFECFSNALAGV